MANPYLVTQLLQDLKDIGTLPPSDSNSTARFLGFLNRSQDTYLATLLLDVHEQHRVASSTVEVTSATTNVLVPSRAIGAKLKMLEAVTGSGTQTLHPMPLERRQHASLGGGDYYFEGNRVVLLRPFTGTLRFTYYRRLGRLVAETAVAAITGLNTATRQVTTATPPGAWGTVAAAYDFVQANPHFDVLGASESATRAGNVFTFTNALPTDLAVGDYVCLAGETPICQAPVELHPVLIQHAVVKHFEARKDSAGVKLAKAELLELREMALRLLAPRADGTPEVLFNPNGPGFRRGSARRVR